MMIFPSSTLNSASTALQIILIFFFFFLFVNEAVSKQFCMIFSSKMRLIWYAADMLSKMSDTLASSKDFCMGNKSSVATTWGRSTRYFFELSLLLEKSIFWLGVRIILFGLLIAVPGLGRAMTATFLVFTETSISREFS